MPPPLFDPLAPRERLALAAPDARVELSVLIPAYNAARFLATGLQSLARQRFDGLEVLVCDDASVDDTADVLAAAQADAGMGWGGRLRVLRQPVNQGVGPARNRLLQAAAGRYLWFVDADDELVDGAIDRLLPLLRRGDLDAVGFDFLIRSDARRSASRHRHDAHVRSFVGRCGERLAEADAVVAGSIDSGQLHPWSRIVHRRAWDGAPAFPASSVFEDVATMPLVLQRCASYWHVAAPLLAYRQHADSAMHRLSERKILEMSACTAGLGRGLREAGAGPASRAALHSFARGVYVACARQFAKSAQGLGAAHLALLRENLARACGPDSDISVSPAPGAPWSREPWGRRLQFTVWRHAPGLAALPKRWRQATRARRAGR